MEGYYGPRKAYGSDFNPDCGTDAPERNQRVYCGKNISYSLILAYVGTNYFGWQRAAPFPTIQETLEGALKRIFQEGILCEAASRTDRGVHAAGQIVQFSASKRMDPHRLRNALNAVLPSDIRILQASEVISDFHPSLDAQAKTYRYYLCNGLSQTPFERKFSWHYPYAIDLAIMRRAADQCIGDLDFRGFTTQPQRDTIRSMLRIELISLPSKRLCIEMTANRFLYKMARTLAGTLANIGSGKLPPDRLPALFASGNRALAGVTAPAHGLTLHQVHYPESKDWLIPVFPLRY